ncbi:leucine-rich melanocyte differentiation-associated protein-like isoform X2 [Amphibalanus amphitrite]|uniref:leucine-rich melanocyte differentiation-associated protein-like isoform X2 n=1 Tax=Amphibalanus amphitrite TaxID=1232801 RepID=UPI001C91EF16|nr:leucine-rich melanocyte differentiation-associated protein-like isoform X2 [Amphibalanus amphitrite]
MSFHAPMSSHDPLMLSPEHMRKCLGKNRVKRPGVYMLAAAGASATVLQLPSLRADPPEEAVPRGREMGDAAEFRHEPAQGADQKALSLAYRDLRDVSNYVADQHGATINYLDLSHNKISNLQFLVRFERLATLVLDHNRLISHSLPPPMPHLTTLWINHNKIKDLQPFLRALRYNCPNIRHLSMIGNPSVPSLVGGSSRGDLYRYRIMVLTYFPRLASLDQQRVEAWERPDSDTLWAKVTSPENWREVQRKVSVTASDVADKVSSTVGQGFDRVATWWESQRTERDTRQHVPRNVMV